MDIQPQTAQPISDDQELAKVLAGVSQVNDDNLNFEETPIVPTVEAEEPKIDTPETTEPAAPAPVVEEPKSEPIEPTASDTDDLNAIKKNALIELRPLVEKLNLSAEEKFNIYLLLLRSTDDKSLIAPAHNAAQGIVDETTRAQALLDIIKEIDYLSNPSQNL